jgi:hypothetical protein
LIQFHCPPGGGEGVISPDLAGGEEMDFWDILQDAAWAAAVLLLLWMVVDAVRVSRRFGEDVLTSSQEGIDELVQQQEQHKGGR